MIPPYSHYPARAARYWPERVAIVEGPRQLTYAELDHRASRVAGALIQLGLEHGDRVAIIQQNRIEYVEAVIGIARAGGVLVPMLGALTETEHSFMVKDSGARFIVALGPERVERARAIAPEDVGVLAFGSAEGAVDLTACIEANRDIPQGPIDVDRPPSALAQILYTSGTTGHPKGVTHSYASVTAAMGFWANTFDLGPEDRLLGQLALSHFGGRAMDSCWVAGARLVILPEPDPGAILAAVSEHRVSMVLLVPTLLRMLLDHPEAQSADLESLRVVVYAASPAAPTLVQRALERLGPVLYTGFGQTEAYGLNTIMGPAEHQQALAAGGGRLASIGRECAAAQVRIRSENGADCPPGEVGEIWVCAPWITPGFWHRPDLDRARLCDGWLRTGDLGRIESDGYIYLADRKEDMIITGGYNVYPAEVENVLMEHVAVAECGVFAVPDAKWGEAIRAAIVLRSGQKSTAEELAGFARERLARHKVPKVIEIVTELPKSPVGKILRRALREPYWVDHEKHVHGAE